MTLWIVLDLIVIIIYIASILFFRKKGFLKAGETIISLILTICLFSFLSPFFESIIDNSILGKNIHQKVSDTLIVQNSNNNSTETQYSKALPDFLQNTLDNSLKSIDDTKNNILTTTAEQTSKLIIRIISAILLFLLIKILIFILFRLLEFVFHIGILKTVNHTLGIMLGIINATIIIYILCAVVVVFMPAEYSVMIKEAISRTYIAHFFYNDNILMKLFL